MNTHDFYNMLNGRVRKARLADSAVAAYPKELKDRYNAAAARLESLRDEVLECLETMQDLEREAMACVTKNY